MRRIQLLSIGMSAVCGAGVLMAAILTNNGERMPIFAHMVPTKSPVMQLDDVPQVKPRQIARGNVPAGVDPVVTSSIKKPRKKQTLRNISDLIGSKKIAPRTAVKGGKTVKVQSGDSLFAIAKRTGVTTKLLAEINSLEAPFIIRPGQILHLQRN